MFRSPKRRVVFVAVLALVILGAAGAALASHSFSDVPDTAWFHDDVAAIAGAGVTGGCGPDTYCPDSNVTRAQMAAFLERSMGRAGYNVDLDLAAVGWDLDGAGASAELALVTAVTIDSGASSDGNGFVVLNAAFEPWTIGANAAAACPCVLEFVIATEVEGVLEFVSPIRYAYVPDTAGEMGFVGTTGSVIGVADVPADSTATYMLFAFLDDSDVAWIAVDGEISATYLPLGPDGDNTIIYDSVAPAGSTYSPSPELIEKLRSAGSK